MSGRRHSPLREANRALGARLVDFSGWEMPLQFEGVVAEHNTVRNDVGIFDVSHLGKLRVAGPDAGAALQRALTADVESLEVGRARYALVLTDDAGTIDDVFVYRLDHDVWLVVPNAANNASVADAIGACGGVVADEWDRWAIIAIQGPRSFELFDRVWPGSGATELKLHRFTMVTVFEHDAIVARTGYTGERGFELYVPAPAATRAYEALLESGGRPVGLGARDTLRLEMGYALYGHELDLDITPLEANLGWAIAWDTEFVGKDALQKVAQEGPRRRLFGIRCTQRGVPRRGYPVRYGGETIGNVTSGNHSPTLNTGIALALGPSGSIPEVGDEVAISGRGRDIAGAIVQPPFVTKGN